MNVQDALGITETVVEENTSNIGKLDGIHTGCAEIEATLAELLGADNEEVGKLGGATAQAETAAHALRVAQVEIETLKEILGSIL